MSGQLLIAVNYGLQFAQSSHWVASVKSSCPLYEVEYMKFPQELRLCTFAHNSIAPLLLNWDNIHFPVIALESFNGNPVWKTIIDKIPHESSIRFKLGDSTGQYKTLKISVLNASLYYCILLKKCFFVMSIIEICGTIFCLHISKSSRVLFSFHYYQLNFPSGRKAPRSLHNAHPSQNVLPEKNCTSIPKS